MNKGAPVLAKTYYNQKEKSLYKKILDRPTKKDKYQSANSNLYCQTLKKTDRTKQLDQWRGQMKFVEDKKKFHCIYDRIG